ncbi:MAG: class II fructose-bisphosphate aldolase [Candidatus Sumerlaeota bacterium]|nr:class II fructose-bisphosphate aldolase [Candidatus Sumerlaeota bacterium]
MPLTTTKEMVQKAYKEHYAVAAMNTNGGNYDIMRAILETAEEMKAPVILNCYTVNAQYQGFEHIAISATRLIREFAPSIPAALHLDHGKTFGDVVRALRAGFTSVMYDGSSLPVEENVAISRQVVEAAHACGVPVEAELGQLLQGQSDPDNPAIVQVEDVKKYTAGVEVDMLAIAIGNSHGYYKGIPKINIQRLKEVRAVTRIPLVLHGCTGMPEEVVRECISLGMGKINFGTMLRNNYLKYYKDAIENTDHQGHPWRVMQVAKDKLKKDVAWILGLTGSAGKA